MDRVVNIFLPVKFITDRLKEISKYSLNVVMTKLSIKHLNTDLKSLKFVIQQSY